MKNDADLALECFECVLRYCEDLPPDPELTEVKYVYTVLMVIIKELQNYIVLEEIYNLFISVTALSQAFGFA
jgi:myosin XV